MSVIQKLKYKIHLRKDLKRRMMIINNCNINVLFDIGANKGQFSEKMRDLGYNGKIVSFEPLNDVFGILKQNSSNDENWIVNNYALGNENIKSIINISGKSDSSSILNMHSNHINSSIGLEYIAKQEIEIKKLDSVFDYFATKTDKVMIKIDTQGYEKNVIDGAVESLQKIAVIQLEMSIIPMYENEMLMVEMIRLLENKGFILYSIENGHYNRKTGQLLQVDGIFVNKNCS